MPPRITRNAEAGQDYGNPFVGPVDHTNQLAVDVGLLTAAEVDANGYIRPGLPLAADGTLIGIAPDYAYGAVVEATKVAEGNTQLQRDAAGPAGDGIVRIAVARSGLLNRDIVEDNLGRVLSADEIAGIGAASSRLALV